MFERAGAIQTVFRILTGIVLGVVMGFATTLGYLAFRAAVEEVYLHSWSDLFALPYYIPALLPLVSLLAGAVRLPARGFWRVSGLFLTATAAGSAIGAGLGALTTTHASGPWAGGLIGAGVAALLVSLATLVHAFRTKPDRDSPWDGSGPMIGAYGVLGAVLLGGCGPTPAPAPGEARLQPAVDSSSVESVVFLLGDPGVARAHSFPVLRRMRQDVEAWSSILGGDGHVRLLLLGDLVYPEGIHPVGHPTRETDSLRLVDQISVVGGPRADAADARAAFIAGNHDWGQEEDVEGAIRLVRLDEFLRSWEGEGQGRVSLAPAPDHGVHVTDLGRHLRMILLDTGWWILGRDEGDERAFTKAVRHALETAGDRRILVAAHHPMESGGPHGVGVDLGSFLGIRTLLKKAGILVQDLDSKPYASLERRLSGMFSQLRRPDVFAGGHDHSLQVFSGPDAGGRRALVVGSSSKLSGVTDAPGMLFGRSEPGYGKLLVLDDGDIVVELDAAPAEYLSCGPEDDAECLGRGIEAYRTVWRETVPRPELAGSD